MRIVTFETQTSLNMKYRLCNGFCLEIINSPQRRQTFVYFHLYNMHDRYNMLLLHISQIILRNVQFEEPWLWKL